MTDKLIEQLKSLRDYIAKNLSEPYSDDDVVALDKAIAALERQRATNPQRFKCPSCGAPLYRVRQSSGSYLNADQFDAARAGDWYCDKCAGTRGASGYRYYWNSELAAAPDSHKS